MWRVVVVVAVVVAVVDVDVVFLLAGVAFAAAEGGRNVLKLEFWHMAVPTKHLRFYFVSFFL